MGGHCCARHGCFAPGSMVDFQKGERQMNMDWSLCEALASTNVSGIDSVLHIYDIGCQYHIHLHDRINNNPLLEVDDKIKLVEDRLVPCSWTPGCVSIDMQQATSLGLELLMERSWKHYGQFLIWYRQVHGLLPKPTGPRFWMIIWVTPISRSWLVSVSTRFLITCQSDHIPFKSTQ